MIMNRISEQVEDYISYKRGLGFKLHVEAAELRRFAAFTEGLRYRNSVNAKIAHAWVESTPGISDKFTARRIETVAVFAKYAVAIDLEARLVPRMRVRCHGKSVPHIYTLEEEISIMDEMGHLFATDGMRALTAPVIFGLLVSTGMRPSEPLRLTDGDVNLGKQTIYVRHTKFSKSRIVPISESTAHALADYRDSRRSTCGDGDAFFLWSGGRPVNIRQMEYALQLAAKPISTECIASGVRAVRLYDARHTFASRTIERWLVDGDDIDAMMPILSTYLGHVKIEDTYWYLTGTPELLAIAASKRSEGIGGERSWRER